MKSISQQMISKEKEQFFQYLVEQKNTILEEWIDSIIIPVGRPQQRTNTKKWSSIICFSIRFNL